MERRDVVLAIVWRDGKVLICQRRTEDPFGGFWEFPGGKREEHESVMACLGRELREELGIGARPLRALEPIEHEYPHLHVRLLPFLCLLEEGEPRPLAAQQVRWVAPGELCEYRFPSANDALVEQILRRLPPTPAE